MSQHDSWLCRQAADDRQLLPIFCPSSLIPLATRLSHIIRRSADSIRGLPLAKPKPKRMINGPEEARASGNAQVYYAYQCVSELSSESGTVVIAPRQEA